MTPDLSSKQCKDNTADGVAAIPLTSLTGVRAQPAGGQPAIAPANQAASTPALAPSANRPAGRGVAPGAYECWGNGQPRLLLNFTALANGGYRDSEGKMGTISVDANGRVTFRGGTLDGFMPSGFYAVYHAPQGRPTVSFRNSGGSEAQYCELAR